MASAPATAAASRLDLEPYTPAELYELFRGGEPDADECEAILARMARIRGAIDVATAEGLDALRRNDRLAELASHLDDYAREVLDLRRRAVQELARLGRDLRTRPILREALCSGRVRLRAAQTVARVAIGEAEATWVERAERMTVRELEAAVRQARPDAGDDDEPWLRLRAGLAPAERTVVDEALALAGEVLPGSSRIERLEAIAQEFAGEHPLDPEADPVAPVRDALQPIGEREDRRATLEAETERWAVLRAVADAAVPDVRFYETATAHDVDAKLRELARLRAQVDDVLGYCAAVVKKSRMWKLLGFASFRQYSEERLGLGARTVEERAKAEERRWRSPALREAKRQGLGFEKLRLLSRLREEEIEAWAPRAEELTCSALRRELEVETERQMRARRKLSVALPLRVAAVLAAAVQAVRERLGRCVPAGKCLAIVAQHFIDVWGGLAKRRKSRAQKIRERDLGWCQVPGCSHRATQTHHVLYRSHGGGDDPENKIGLCAFHHLRCIHGGWLRVVGKAPDQLRWFLNGEPWAGPRGATAQ
ncbi:MAG TPA: HNH endonuclease signature motif containing protein [Anaeromyxobacteraceae bacterium]|nr:HNH endonuclease signature motif containing protein [Anaeromyxobacteraceae bacterium]